MKESSLCRSVVPHCELIDIIGITQAVGGLLFVPALLNISQEAPPGFWLDEHSVAFKSDPSTSVESRVWSRIGHHFGFSPLISFSMSDPEWYPAIDVGFVVVLPSLTGPILSAIPFACRSVPHPYPYSEPAEPWRMGLVFSVNGPDDQIKGQIAAAFWGLLTAAIAEPEIHCYESIRLAALNSDHSCEDCDGTGCEGDSIFCLRTPCATCYGTGRVSWRAEPLDVEEIRSGFVADYTYEYV